MKQTLILTIAALLAIGAVGCRGHKTEEELTDAEKLEVLDLRIERSPNDADLRAKRARILLGLNRTKEALSDISKAVDIDPDKVEYHLLAADIYFASGDIKNSYRALGEAEELAPKSKDVQLKMGEITYYSRDYDRSLQHLAKVIEQEPNNRTALFMQGFIYKEKGDTAQAVSLFRHVCDIYPDYEPAFEELGVLFAGRKSPIALEYLSTAMRLEPSNTNVLYVLAMYYQDLEQYDEAERYYNQILDINPYSADAWHNLGYLEMTVYGDFDRALEYFDKALEADPRHEAAQMNRNLAYELKNSK